MDGKIIEDLKKNLKELIYNMLSDKELDEEKNLILSTRVNTLRELAIRDIKKPIELGIILNLKEKDLNISFAEVNTGYNRNGISKSIGK